MSSRNNALRMFAVSSALFAWSSGSAPAHGASKISVVSPPPGSALRAQVLDALRNTPDAKFIVDRLNVATKGTTSLAFFSGRPECCDGADYLLRKVGNGRWKPIWSLGRGGGSGDCLAFAASDQRAINIVTKFGLKASTFAPELIAARDLELAEAKNGTDCVGDSGIG